MYKTEFQSDCTSYFLAVLYVYICNVCMRVGAWVVGTELGILFIPYFLCKELN